MASVRETFLYTVTPDDYDEVSCPSGGKREGYVWSKSGMGQYEFSLNSVSRYKGVLLACTPKHVGEIPGSASEIEPLDAATLSEIEGTLGAPTVTKETVDEWELLGSSGSLDDLGETYAEQTPVRHLLQTETFDMRVKSGKTLYGVEVGSDLAEGILIGVASRHEYGTPMKLRKWTPLMVGMNTASMIVQGVEFRVFLYAKDLPLFSIDYLKIFFKLTDRRGQYYGYQDLSFESRRPVGYGQERSA